MRVSFLVRPIFRRCDRRIGADMFGNEVGVSPESVACAFDPNDGGVVKQPVEDGRSDDGGSEEDVAPFGKASVRGEDHRAFFVSRIDDLEEEACAAPGDGDATDFVDDEKRGPREEADLLGELSLSFGFGEAAGEFGECRSVDALSGFDGGLAIGAVPEDPVGHLGQAVAAVGELPLAVRIDDGDLAGLG